MREFRTYGSVRGAPGNRRPYRDRCGDSPRFVSELPSWFSFVSVELFLPTFRIRGELGRIWWLASGSVLLSVEIYFFVL